MCYCSPCQTNCPCNAQTKHTPHSRDGSWASPSPCRERHEQMSKKDPFHVLASPLHITISLIPSKGRDSHQPWQVWKHLIVFCCFEPEEPKLCSLQRSRNDTCRDAQAGSGPHGCISTVLLPILSPCALHARSVRLGRASCARASTTPGPLQTRAYLKFPEGFDVVVQSSSLKKLNCQGCARPNVGNRWLILHVPLSHGLTTGLPKTSTNRCQSHTPVSLVLPATRSACPSGAG